MTEFSGLHAEDVDDETRDDIDDFLNAGMGPEPEVPQDQYDVPPPDFVREEKQSRKSQQYEAKALGILNSAMRAAADDPRTVADAAILILKGKPLARAIGDGADHDARIAHAVDFFVEGPGNSPYLAIAMTAAPIVLQMLRNHEPVMEPQTRGFRIPFTKRTFKLRFGIKLGKLRAVTNEPQALESWVFDNPRIARKMEEMDIQVVRSARKR